MGHMGKMLRIYILDITSIIQLNWNLMSIKAPIRHKIAKTEWIENSRLLPQIPSWKSIFDISSQTYGRFERKLALEQQDEFWIKTS